MNGSQEYQTCEDAPVANPIISTGKEKKCLKCLKNKAFEDFNFRKDNKNGKAHWCRDCANEYGREWTKNHPEKISMWAKTWKKNNPERKKYLNKQWEMNNPEKNRELKLKSAHKNADKHRKKSKIYARKIRSTLKGGLNAKMSKGVRRSLCNGKNGSHWEDLVGYTVEELKKHIEKKFTNGMTWESFLRGEIHIDHKIPLSAFNFEKPEDDDFKRCWSLKNLRPLWKKENLSKGKKIDKHFQPRLIF